MFEASAVGASAVEASAVGATDVGVARSATADVVASVPPSAESLPPQPVRAKLIAAVAICARCSAQLRGAVPRTATGCGALQCF